MHNDYTLAHLNLLTASFKCINQQTWFMLIIFYFQIKLIYSIHISLVLGVVMPDLYLKQNMYANMDECHTWFFSEPTKTLDTIDHEILLYKLHVFCNCCYLECSLLNYIKIIVQRLHIPGLHNYQFCLHVHKFLFCSKMLPTVFSIHSS